MNRQRSDTQTTARPLRKRPTAQNSSSVRPPCALAAQPRHDAALAAMTPLIVP